jgi:hypothetical protein
MSTVEKVETTAGKYNFFTLKLPDNSLGFYFIMCPNLQV